MSSLLKLPLRDRTRAARELGLLATRTPEGVDNRIESLLASSPAPEQGLHYLASLAERHPTVFEHLVASSSGLRYLTGVFTHSRFLSQAVLQNPAWIEELLYCDDLERVRTAEDMRGRLLTDLPHGVPTPLDLARFRRRQLLRILIRDIFELGTLPEITGELSALADTLVQVAYERIHETLVERHGLPRGPRRESQFAVIALGKMGGEELNYSSDIDLMFLYSANGETSGPAVIANKEFFKRAANQLTSLLGAYSAEGRCYRVDLRLRPDGSLGEISISLEGAANYYGTRARDWELQMLIKARVAAGHFPTGRALLEFAEPRIYATSLDFSAIEQLSVTRERLNERLAAREQPRGGEPAPIDVKLERGGIRDIEFLVQCLQRLHGGTEPWVQHRGTLLALARLHDKGVLKDAEYGRLASAYQFLRHLEHRLQFDEDRQTHTLPRDPEALELLARRMPGGGTAKVLLETLRAHFGSVLSIYDRVVHSRPEAGSSAGVLPTLDQRAPRLAAAFKAAGMQRGLMAFEHFLERLSDDPATLAKLDADADGIAATLDLFEFSPYFGEELIRRPEAVLDLTEAPLAWIREPLPLATPAELRRWYRRGILRLEAESICRSYPIFETLGATSEMAEKVIVRAYDIAVGEVRQTRGPSDPAYRPQDQMSVIALGRLGLREFDLGSDADLTFVVPDSDASEVAFWTRVAERMAQLIGSYTGEGLLFTVDTRLRPNGNAGPLVQTESAVAEYFRHSAEAWESITYLKSRGVAGNLSHAEVFLNSLQQLYFERYGKAGSSRTDLREMRARLERELGSSHALKAGRGGYYDIDFLLLYLRLKSASVFYTVLNTPERIAVLEGLELLTGADAAFLREAATFYRAIDHGLRMICGHAEDRLPKPGAQLDTLTALIPRWTPVPLSDLDRIRRETRALFDRYFL